MQSGKPVWEKSPTSCSMCECMFHPVHPTLKWHWHCVTDVTFIWDAMDFPEGIGALIPQQTHRKSEAGWKIIFLLKSKWNQRSICLTLLFAFFFFSDDKDRCVTWSLSELDVCLIVRKPLVQWFRSHTHILNVIHNVSFQGPSGVGVHELKRRLLLSDPDHYGVTVPCKITSKFSSHFEGTESHVPLCLLDTTREKTAHEKEGVDYHFVSVHKFEEDILSHRYKTHILT